MKTGLYHCGLFGTCLLAQERAPAAAATASYPNTAQLSWTPNDGSSFIMSATAGAASAPVRMPDLTRPKGALAPLTAVYSDDTWSNRVWNQVTLGFLEKSRQHM